MTTEGGVYALIDPRTDDPRYVGATIDPHARLSAHLSTPPNSDVRAWIDELDEQDLEPEMAVLRWVNVQDLRAEEQDVLDRLLDEYDLLNAQTQSYYPSDRDGEPTDQRGRHSIRLNPELTADYLGQRPDDMGDQEFIRSLLDDAEITVVRESGLDDDERDALAETEATVQRIEETINHLPDRTASAVEERFSNSR
jgi:hypothetical protein